MKLSYAICVHNESRELYSLLQFLVNNKDVEDEINVLVDSAHVTPQVRQVLEHFADKIVQNDRPFCGELSEHRNFQISTCSGDYIFIIDADEMLSKELIDNLPNILELNPTNEVYLVPRINTVDGLTQDHIKKWGWNVNQDEWINFPDYQWRIYKNDPKIIWVNKVHERLSGFNTYATLPAAVEYCLLHHKTISKQEMQNKFYDTL